MIVAAGKESENSEMKSSVDMFIFERLTDLPVGMWLITVPDATVC